MSDLEYQELTQLGQPMPIPASPNEARLETVPNPHPDVVYLVRFTCPEFTTLCPVTGQPDFAHLVIDYLPKARLIESKSLKLYLASFRDRLGFHEDCTLPSPRRLAPPPSRFGCASAATGTRGAAFRSMCSGSPPSLPPASGCRTRACRRTGAWLVLHFRPRAFQRRRHTRYISAQVS